MTDRDHSPSAESSTSRQSLESIRTRAGSYMSASSAEVTRPGYRVRETLPAIIAVTDNLATCWTKRGACRGLITKGETKVSIIQDTELKRWNIAEIRKLLTVVHNQNRRFRELHQHICDQFPEQIDVVAEEKVLTSFNELMDAARDRLEEMESAVVIYLELASVEKSVRLILDAGVDVFTEDQLRKCETRYSRVTTAHNETIAQDDRLEPLSDSILLKLHQITRKVAESRAATVARVLPPPDKTPTESTTRPYGYGFDRKRELLKVELPSFKGEVRDWPRFWKAFSKHIDSNESLDEEDKLHYLRRYIDSPNDRVIVEDSSDEAGQYAMYITLLKEKYDKPRVVHTCHVKELLSIPGLKNESGSEIARVQGAVAKAVIKLQSTGQFTAEALLTSYVETLLTPRVKEEWYKDSRTQTDVPNIEELLKFLRVMASYKDSLNPEKSKAPIKAERNDRNDRPKHEQPYRKGRNRSGQPQQTPVRKEVYVNTKTWPDCRLCKTGSHAMYMCATFLGYDLEKRIDYARQEILCGNCLGASHETAACRNSYRCRECGGKHNTTLHREGVITQGAHMVEDAGKKAATTISPTLELIVHSPTGKQSEVTALFDTGASISLVTEDTVNQLGLRRQKTNVQVVGVEGDQGQLHTASTVSLTLTSLHQKGSKLKTRVFVVPQIGGKQGKVTATIAEGSWMMLQGLTLANPNFHKPGQLELLLGNDVLGDIELPEVRKCGRLIARNTIFGWVVNGQSTGQENTQQRNRYVCAITGAQVTPDLLTVQETTNRYIQEFFHSEEVPEHKTQTAEDMEALRHYEETHKVLPSGQFQVSLPKLPGHNTLGLSRGQAIRRYMSNEQTLQRKGEFNNFQRVVAEYLELGHAELVPTNDLIKPAQPNYYLPMHAVYKESTTSPLRVVFDASAATSTGVSLNDTLLTGPTVYPSLTEILIRFRQHNVALTADISKMFRCIVLDPEDRSLHRFVWRRQPNGPLQDYQMTRVTFGVSCSPFLATQTLQQIAENMATTRPLAAQALRSSFYVDDYISGTATQKEAIHIQQELREVLQTHGLVLRKWRSNSAVVLGVIPEDQQEKTPDRKPYGPHDHLKTLGIHWDAEGDVFRVSTSKLSLTDKVTKRMLASDVAQTYDILGWFAPATIQMKLLIQELWRSEHGWDDAAGDSIQQQWQQWKSELPNLAARPIPRQYFHQGNAPSDISLHGFSDASLKGYSAVVYVRAVYTNAPPTVRLITAKTKVAHVKGTTVPRLELCGTKLLAELITSVQQTLAMQPTQLHCWCDSQVVLYWLDGKRRSHRVYVANRVARTLELVSSDRWKHVPGTENPADCASRGISPQTLLEHPLWWHGPPWLQEEPLQIPPQPALAHLAKDKLVVKETVALVTQQQPLWILTRCSTFGKSRRLLAWIRRFTHNSRATKMNKEDRRESELTREEIQEAESLLYLQSQQRIFSGNHPERWTSDKSTKGLNPKKDALGLYRVDGRLHNSPMEYAARHPIILKGTDPLTRQLISHHHQETLHGGPSQVLTSLSRQYFLLNGMAVVKATCRACVVCIKFNARREKQLMGQLPSYRVTPGKVFDVVGTDFAGPIIINQGNPRKPRKLKAYICVFVCMSTKAIHLEVVMGLSTEDFLACLRRFIARRGKPSRIMSDNGTNFTGAARSIDTVFQLLRTEECKGRVTRFCTTSNIQWVFNPARAPHFGGIWEATVKSVKHHLRRIEYRRTFTYEEMTTTLCQIEAVLNSRPLMAIYSQSTEGLEVLTAGHFLIGRPLLAMPEAGLSLTTNLLKRWDSCQQATQRFWQEWSRDYLQMFHRRSKWQKPAKNVEVGDIVLLRDEVTYHKNDWPLARVVEVYPGKDGLVRAVDVQHGKSIWRRPIAKLTVLLPVTMEDNTTDGELQATLISRGGGCLRSGTLSDRQDVRKVAFIDTPVQEQTEQGVNYT